MPKLKAKKTSSAGTSGVPAASAEPALAIAAAQTPPPKSSEKKSRKHGKSSSSSSSKKAKVNGTEAGQSQEGRGEKKKKKPDAAPVASGIMTPNVPVDHGDDLRPAPVAKSSPKKPMVKSKDRDVGGAGSSTSSNRLPSSPAPAPATHALLVTPKAKFEKPSSKAKKGFSVPLRTTDDTVPLSTKTTGGRVAPATGKKRKTPKKEPNAAETVIAYPVPVRAPPAAVPLTPTDTVKKKKGKGDKVKTPAMPPTTPPKKQSAAATPIAKKEMVGSKKRTPIPAPGTPANSKIASPLRQPAASQSVKASAKKASSVKTLPRPVTAPSKEPESSSSSSGGFNESVDGSGDEDDDEADSPDGSDSDLKSDEEGTKRPATTPPKKLKVGKNKRTASAPAASVAATIATEDSLNGGGKRKAEAEAHGDDGHDGAGGLKAKKKVKAVALQEQSKTPGVNCARCGGKDAPISLCCECDRGFHPQCMDPPRIKQARVDWVCDDCNQKPKAVWKSPCPQCGEAAGQHCALCSACGVAYHPMCLEPPLVQRPKGSSPGRGIKDWICFHCECALPVVVAAGEDDPDAMEALSWSEDFSPPSENKLKAFWGREHGRAKVEHEERAEMDRKRKENERRRRAEREESGLEVEEDRAQGGGKHGGRKYTGNGTLAGEPASGSLVLWDPAMVMPEADHSPVELADKELTEAIKKRADGSALLHMHRAIGVLTQANGALSQMVAWSEKEIKRLRAQGKTAERETAASKASLTAGGGRAASLPGSASPAPSTPRTKPAASPRGKGKSPAPAPAVSGEGVTRVGSSTSDAKMRSPKQSGKGAAAAAATVTPASNILGAAPVDAPARKSNSAPASTAPTAPKRLPNGKGKATRVQSAEAQDEEDEEGSSSDVEGESSSEGEDEEATVPGGEAGSSDDDTSTDEETSGSASGSATRALGSPVIAATPAAVPEANDDDSSDSESDSSSSSDDDSSSGQTAQEKPNGLAAAAKTAGAVKASPSGGAGRFLGNNMDVNGGEDDDDDSSSDEESTDSE